MNKDNKIRKNKHMENKEKIKIAIVGILTGLLCGLFASGGGLILVPAFVYIFKQDEKRLEQCPYYAYFQWYWQVYFSTIKQNILTGD